MVPAAASPVGGRNHSSEQLTSIGCNVTRRLAYRRLRLRVLYFVRWPWDRGYIIGWNNGTRVAVQSLEELVNLDDDVFVAKAELRDLKVRLEAEYLPEGWWPISGSR